MRSHYDRCRQTLAHSLKTQFGQKAEILGEKAGMHVMVRLHTPFSDEEIIARAAKGWRRPDVGCASLFQSQLLRGIYFRAMESWMTRKLKRAWGNLAQGLRS